MLQRSRSVIRRIVRELAIKWYVSAGAVVLAVISYLLRGKLIAAGKWAVAFLQSLPGAPLLIKAAAVALGLIVLVSLALAWRWGSHLTAVQKSEVDQQEHAAQEKIVERGARIAISVAAAARIDREIRREAELITPVSELRRDRLKLGDDSAATFPYVPEPVQAAYDAACRQLRMLAHGLSKFSSLPEDNAALHGIDSITPPAAHPHRGARGILITGEANAGKTRLAYEAVTSTLPDWDILQWHAAYTLDNIPPREVLDNRRVVLWVDDLHEYTSLGPVAGVLAASGAHAPALATRAETLLALVLAVRRANASSILVMTCRTPHLQKVRQAFGPDFLEQVSQISIPTFAGERESEEAQHIIQLFERAREAQPSDASAEVRADDWDGTLGSLLLGLQRREDVYRSLADSSDPAVIVLRAMKLLTRAGTTDHTAPRLQTVCSEVFGHKDLGLPGDRWYHSISTLLEYGFVTRTVVQLPQDEIGHPPKTEEIYVIRKDSYFERVVTDYPLEAVPGQLQYHLDKLHAALRECGDAVALYNLGVTYTQDQSLLKAVVAYKDAADADPGDFATLYNYGAVLSALERFNEALFVLEQARELRPQDAATLIRIGMTADALARQARLGPRLGESQDDESQDQALKQLQTQGFDAYRQASQVEPQYALAWIHWAGALLRARPRTSAAEREAEQAYLRAIELEPDNPEWHTRYAILLADLGRHTEAAEQRSIARTLRDEDSFTS